MSEKRTISHDDYLKLRGLLALAEDHYKAMRDIERCVAKLVGEEDDGHGYFGQASDAVWSAHSAQELLENRMLEVEPPIDAPPKEPA